MELNLVFNLEIRNMNLNDAIAKYIQKQKTATKIYSGFLIILSSNLS